MKARAHPPLDWPRVRRFFEQTVDLEPAERRAAMAGMSGATDALMAEVERLLTASDSGPSALDDTAAELLETRDGTPSAPDPRQPPEARDLIGTSVGGYVLRERISSGGMGDVYRAEREVGSARRKVAVKILKRGLDTDALLRRFRREQETLAALHHEHVVGFLDAGSLPDGRPWFVMEHVDGVPLTEACRTLDLDARVALMATVCDAVQFAHRNLVLHRDLKPSNILVTTSGTPKLLDFGVAALLQPDGDVDHTDATRSLVPLTPRYASPEQLRRERVAVPTDVHALGLVLFEVLTGRPARSSESLVGILESAGEVLPAPSSVLSVAVEGDDASSASDRSIAVRRMRGDLDAIVRHATHPEADRRYPSVEALAADLRHWRQGDPVTARRDTGWERTRRFVKRHRLGVGLVSALILLLAAGLMGTWIGRERAIQNASRGWGAHGQARAATRFLEQLIIDRLGPTGAALPAVQQAAALPPLFVDPDVEASLRESLSSLPEAEALVRMALGRLALSEGQVDAAQRHLLRAASLIGPGIALGKKDEARLQQLLRQAQSAHGSEKDGTPRDEPQGSASEIPL